MAECGGAVSRKTESWPPPWLSPACSSRSIRSTATARPPAPIRGKQKLGPPAGAPPRLFARVDREPGTRAPPGAHPAANPGPDPAERELVRRARRGDEAAREALVQLHRRGAYLLALQLLGN